MPIPKIIFQTWKSKTEFPDNFSYWSKTIRDENPTYAYWLWDDADNRAFISQKYPWFLERYDSYPAEIYRVDAVRYFFLFEYGGIYADMDVESIRSFDDVIKIETGIVLGRMGPNPKFEHSIPNAIMFSRPKQEFWLFVMSLLFDPPNTITNKRPEYRTGPVLLKMAYDIYTTRYRDDAVQNRIASIRTKVDGTESEKTEITLLAGPIFYPLDWNDQVHDYFVMKRLMADGKCLDRSLALKLFPRSISVTYWSHSWESKSK